MSYCRKWGLLLVILSIVCSIRAQSPTFENPLGKGQDPWIVKHDGLYYTCYAGKGGIWVTESRFLTRTEEKKLVWSPPKDSWNSYSIWAPELHPVNGKWYIYYAAGENQGSPYHGQRTGVLEGDYPFGPYTDKGMVYTGDDPEQKEDNIWAIDMTILEHNGKLYGIWSGWPYQTYDGDPDQNLYIAPMENPWTVGQRVLLSTPSKQWEKGEHFGLQEGPQILKHKEDVFIIYSTRGSWTKHYKLGQLRLASPDSDPLDPASWIKKGPVFKGTPTVYGVGHASFTTSPDDSEYWIYYHTKTEEKPGWNRDVLLQKFTFDEEGNPDFGIPAGNGTMERPSGEVELEENN